MDEATAKALFDDVRYALRRLDPWPPKDPPREGEKAREYARRVVEQLRLSGYIIQRGPPVQHRTSENSFPGFEG